MTVSQIELTRGHRADARHLLDRVARIALVAVTFAIVAGVWLAFVLLSPAGRKRRTSPEPARASAPGGTTLGSVSTAGRLVLGGSQSRSGGYGGTQPPA